MASTILCPVIAEQEIIITADNLHGLSLSNYGRSPGTEVRITCLSNSSHKLIGPSVIKCLSNGQWNSSIPACVAKWNSSNIIFPDTTAATVTLGQSQWSDYAMLPYMVALAILGITCLVLICLLSYMICSWKKDYSKGSSVLYDSNRSSIPTETDQTDFWVDMADMATARNFRCHEMAQSRDGMVQNLRYTHLHPDWSGY